MSRLAPRVLLALGSSLVLAGCTAMMLGGGESAGGPVGAETRQGATIASDERIADAVRRRFDTDASLADRDLGVEVRRGVVTLRGTVDSWSLRDRAERLAIDIAGVRSVNNQLSVRR